MIFINIPLNLQTNEVHRKIISKYNRMAECLLTFEMKHIEAFTKVYDVVKTCKFEINSMQSD